MIINNIETIGLNDLMKDLLNIDAAFATKGKSNPESDNPADRIQLGSKQASILSQVLISMDFSNVTLYELDMFKKLASNVYVETARYRKYPVTFKDNLSNATDISAAYPDIYRYVGETEALNQSLVESQMEDIKSMSAAIIPSGNIVFDGVMTFTGINVLSLFNGMFETYVYRMHKTADQIDGEDGWIKKQIYMSFMDSYSKYCVQSDNKTGLIEDYLINKQFFSYIDASHGEYTADIAKVIYPQGIIPFFGVEKIEQLKYYLEGFAQSNTAKTTVFNAPVGLTDFDPVSFTRGKFEQIDLYFGCCCDIVDFMILKLFGTNIQIVADEGINAVFAQKNFKLDIGKELQTAFGTRLNTNIANNLDMKNLVAHDKFLSFPANRAGMILSGQKIKFLVKVNLATVGQMDLGYVDTTIRQLIFSSQINAWDILRTIKEKSMLLTTKHLFPEKSEAEHVADHVIEES